MIKNNDLKNAEKIIDLYEKLEKSELSISFSGHFSAGKSSMINALMGEDILPKSPIPTSANIVKVNSGEGVARIYFKHDDPLEYDEPYDLDMIKNYSTDKDSIRKIDISTKKQIIPEGASIVDTPGIDAADDADRIMTESSLHIVDVLFYVMDYNHVQSEVNMQFLQSVEKKEIPFYIIINQIDKHDERELLFTDFQESVKQTFDQWNLHPENIFYTSLFEPNMPQNQFTEVKSLLFTMMTDKESHDNIDASVRQVMEDHKHFLKTQTEEKMTDAKVADTENEDFGQFLVIEQKLKDLYAKREQLEVDFQEEMKQTLTNAYLMPASLRDLAHLFLESEQSDFKVGFFGSKKKTANERQRRLDAFLSKLKENIEASIQWKLRDKFTAIATKYDVANEEIQKQIQAFSVSYTADDVKQLIKPGAKVNGDSVLNYTNEVSADIKNKYRKKALDLLSFLSEHLKTAQKEEEAKLKQQLNELQELAYLQEIKEQFDAELKEKYRMLDAQLSEPSVDKESWYQIKTKLDERRKAIKKATSPQVMQQAKKETAAVQDEGKKTNEYQEYSIAGLLEDIDRTIQTVEGLPGFHAIIEDLRDKKKALTNRSYTIALFGAFSAGKSSFANSLMGEKVLPVSPNPTTATVNRIQPVSKENRHGTVVVRLKDDEVLTKELKQITKAFSPKAENFHELLEWVKKEKIYNHPELDNMYQAFLHAMVDGYAYSKEFIGKSKTITLDAFPAYVADESKACYVESIDLYYDCALTRQGITLVDTPGADSVNARHTNVAFEYIKHADAILYVTYYNHALSRADKDFLMQLGRVKEAFELDKMFFIVNAADLAQDETELKMVTDYVEEQLATLGIRLPRLYPVSSKQSLEEKMAGDVLNDKMQKFENRFDQFIKSDLAKLTIQSALWDMHRTSQSLEQYIASVNMDEDAKEKRREELLRHQDQFNHDVDAVSSDTYKKKLTQRVERQLYYVQERLSIRFHDMFKEMFNPTKITESGRKGQTQLKSCLNNLIEYVGHELLQEVQAVSLRMEAFIEQLAGDLHGHLAVMGEKNDELFILPNLSKQKLTTPEYSQAFEQLDRSIFDKALKLFKGTKAFFEKNEKEQMKEAIYEAMKPFIATYIDDHKNILTAHYLQEWQQVMTAIQTDAKEAIFKHIENYEEMMAAHVEISVLEERRQTIISILDNYEAGDIMHDK